MADITAHEVSVEVLKTVNNDLFTFDDVVQALNEGLGITSFQVLLPRLQASADVLTVDGANFADLPADYQRNLFFCYSTLQAIPVRIFDKKADIVRYYGAPTTNGVVSGVAIFGSTLYYQYIPLLADIDTLVIDYYKQPTTVAERTDTFTCLPSFLIRPLLVNYASAKLFSMIEQGSADTKNNSTYYFKLFDAALISLQEAYPLEKHRG
jgi:hypothetical protein